MPPEGFWNGIIDHEVPSQTRASLPVAMQKDVDMQDTLDSTLLEMPPEGVGTIDHEEPFHDSARNATALSLLPTAIQNVTLVQEMPFSLPPPEGVGVGMIDQGGVALAASVEGIGDSEAFSAPGRCGMITKRAPATAVAAMTFSTKRAYRLLNDSGSNNRIIDGIVMGSCCICYTSSL